LVGGIFGVAQETVLSGADVVLVRRGVFTHAKTAAQAWTVGAKLYWDDTNKVFTTTASGNTLVGAAAVAAANPTDTGTVVLDGAIR
jgi:predicted RecA/RadA family phage recombinase